MTRNLTAAVLAVSAAALSAEEQMPTKLVFGVISTESTVALKPSWEPFIADLSKAVGIPVEAFFASEYAGVIEGMRFKKVDIAWHGNKSAMGAVDRAGGEVFCKVLNMEGQEGYHSYVVAHKDSPFTTIDELLAKGSDITFSMGDPNSTSGTLVPGYYIFAQRAIDPKTHFKRLTSAKHEANALAVANRQVDAATMASDVHERMQSTAPDKVAQLRIVWKSPLIPSDPMVYRADLPKGLKTQIRDFFINYGKTDEEKAKLATRKWSGFRASDNSQLIPIRELELAKKKLEIAADEKLSAEDKKSKTAEIDAQLAALKAQTAK
jgi:phosphonate transport system substrate-binding protein